MFWVGKKHFVSLNDYEDRSFEVNPKDLISDNLREFLSTIPKDKISRYYIKAIEYFKIGEYKKAVQIFTEILTLDINNTGALFYRGQCFIKLERFKNSIDDFTELLNLIPEFTEGYFYRANARSSLQTYSQIKDAITDYSHVIDKEPSNGISLFLRGYCYLLLKKESLAFNDWKKSKEFGIAKENEGNWKRDFLE